MNISLTFDDGWRSQYEHALPILDEYGLKATFYIITCFIRSEQRSYMNGQQVLGLHERGHEIGAHTVDHPNLQRSFLWNNWQILQSKNDLAGIGIDAKTFAYPYGRHNPIVRKKVRNCGFDNARGTNGKFHTREMSRYAIRARTIRATDTCDDIKRWMDYAKDHLLVLAFHQIEDCPLPWACKPGVFAAICKLLSDSAPADLRLTSVLANFIGPDTNNGLYRNRTSLPIRDY